MAAYRTGWGLVNMVLVGRVRFEYISEVLTRIGDHPVNRLEELLPDRWKPATQSPAPSANSPPTSDG